MFAENHQFLPKYQIITPQNYKYVDFSPLFTIFIAHE